MLTHVLWRPVWAADSWVGEVTEQGRREDGERRRAASPSGTELIGIGLSFALSLVIPALAGVGLDALLHSSPVGLVAGMAVGVVACCTAVVVQFRRYL